MSPEIAFAGVYLVGGLFFLYTAVIFHELTHAAAARLLGGRVLSLNLFPIFRCRLAFGSELGTWRDRLTGLAPLLCGVTLGLPTLLALSAAHSSLATLTLGAWLLLYSVPSPEDILLPEEKIELTAPALILLGFALISSVWPITTIAMLYGGQIEAVLRPVSGGFALAGIVLASYGFIAHDKQTDEDTLSVQPSE